MRIAKITVLLAAALALTGCVVPKFLIDIPAVSTPVREARYYQTQDVANAAAGIVADEALRLVFKGPYLCLKTNPATGNLYQTTCGMWSPVWRTTTIAALAMVRRQTDRGYRESGAMFNVLGSWGWEIIRCAFSSGCRTPDGWRQ